ncbi:MAG: endonuclease VIII [Gammaproteobacteria bacterium]|nr:endonuclease VIII [Gammaproteobacteria bacterium]
MPEGPEIRRAADEVATVLLDQRIVNASFSFPELRRFEPRLRGSRVTVVDTRGKAMLTRFANGLTLYSHNQLYGRWYVVRRGDRPETGRSLRVALHTKTHSALLYSASDVAVLTARQLQGHPYLRRLGPDILDAGLDSASIYARLRQPAFCGRKLGALYLDQSFLAGNGNYLRSEVLHAARLHPAWQPAGLKAPALQRLARQTLAVARRSYRSGGITIAQSRIRKLRADGFSPRRFAVFSREDAPCFCCGDDIVRQTFAGRRLYFCPTCQPSPQ